MIRSITALVAFVCLAGSSFAQGTRLLRQPSANQSHVVFVHANDLWVASRDGGEARRLTSAVGAETNPRISPDGQLVAFSGQYDGNTDVYVVPFIGGEPRRLTWHPGADMVTGWTPDGKNVLFTSTREGHPTATIKFFSVALTGGTPKALVVPQASMGDMSSDGKWMAYQPNTFWDPEWRNYRGGQAQPIFILNLETYELKRTRQADNERHVNPVWFGGKVFHLSERDFANNVWSYDPATGAEEQITFHKDFDVKDLSAAGDRIVYEQGGYLHLLDPATKQTKPISINVRGDLNWSRERWETASAGQLGNAQISPTGKRAVFEFRGEIITVPKEEGNWRNLTESSGAADRYPIWSPDGSSVAWFSDADGEYNLMIADQNGISEPRKITLPHKKYYYRPAWSPDGKYIAYTDTDYRLWMVDVSSGATTKIDADRIAHPDRTLNPVWSPDSKWIAYPRLLDTEFKAIFVYSLDQKKVFQVTDGLADAISPAWDESGKYLYFLASTDYGLGSGWLDMSSYNMPLSRGVYMAVLSASEASPLLPKSDEEPVKTDEKAESGGSKSPVKVTIDMDGIANRILALNMPLRNYTDLTAGAEGQIFVSESAPGQQGSVVHRYSLKDREAKEYLRGLNTLVVSHDRKNVLYRAGNTWGIVASTGAPKVGDGRLETGNIRIKLNPREEWAQIFREGWRNMRDYLYVDNTHGAPWNDVYQWYQPWLKDVRHRSDLGYLLDIVSGEIAVGHSYVRGGDYPDVPSIPGGLLGADYETADNRFRIKKIYTGESWNPDLQAPLAQPGIDVKEGDYILEVDGKPLTADMNLYSLFEATANRQTTLRVNSSPTMDGSRLVTVVPISNESGLRSRAWVEGNRRKVDELSGGKLAYVWVPNTGQGGYTYFNRYYFSQQDRKGAVIDERNNGGGSAADYIIDVLARPLVGYFNNRTESRKPSTSPIAGIWGPKVMIINEMAGSGGDLMPYMFRERNIGPLVGTRTWGGLVGTWDTPPYLDGGSMVAPRGGFIDADGNWAVEATGVAPDIEVFQNPADVIRGRDPQLERAVQEALRLLETHEVTLKPEPPAPIRWKRPDR